MLAIRAERSARLGDESALLLLVEKWLRAEFEERKKNRGQKKVKTVLEEKRDDYKTYRDKFYNYWG